MTAEATSFMPLDTDRPTAACESATDEEIFGPDDEKELAKERAIREGQFLAKYCVECPIQVACIEEGAQQKDLGIGTWGAAQPDMKKYRKGQIGLEALLSITARRAAVAEQRSYRAARRERRAEQNAA